MIRYFRQPEDESVWHAYRDEAPAALCGEAQLTYNVDSIADNLPYGAQLHDACRRAIEGESEPAPATTTPKVTSTPKAEPKPKTEKTTRKTTPKA